VRFGPNWPPELILGLQYSCTVRALDYRSLDRLLRVIDTATATATDGADSKVTCGEGSSALQSILDHDSSQSGQVCSDSSNQISYRANQHASTDDGVMKNVPPQLILLPSFVLYCFQVAMFTTDLEIAVCGAYGVMWFLFITRPPYRSSILLGCIAALGLGFSPQRLRLGDSISAMEALVALIHFLSTAIYLWAGRKLTERTSGQ